MDIRIGMMNTGRELNFSSAETPEAVAKKVDEALAGTASLSFTDAKGSTYIVPTAALAYVEIGSEEVRKVGFVA
ncbi:MAG: DUF3107 domain-containing protein [Microbacterium gubbeenense]|uniref:DUF3107 domain-containing protein n=1 Tax=Microbacterium gubbeenense TaxID=159896 RepID=UPI0004080E34|nr:DUF3107 domain-containing protein [Microbacterium gubbeenense]